MNPTSSDGFFTAADNLRLYGQQFTPNGAPLATVGIIHGFCEHSGRYLPLIRKLVDAGFAVHAFDYRGHGQADGRRGHVDAFGDYLGDLDRFVARIRSLEGGAGGRLFLLGHSLGGLILASWLLERAEQDLAGAIFASPYLELAFQPPWYKLAAARVLGRVIPFLPLPNGLTSDQLTADPEMRQAVDRDPLYNHTVTPRWFEETASAQVQVQQRAGEIQVPALVMVAEADPIASPVATTRFAEALGSRDRTVLSYPGSHHEIFNEIPEIRERAMSDVVAWLGARSR